MLALWSSPLVYVMAAQKLDVDVLRTRRLVVPGVGVASEPPLVGDGSSAYDFSLISTKQSSGASPPLVPPKATFDFDTFPTAGWSASEAFRWWSGRTPTKRTGPSTGAGGSGSYYYVESSASAGEPTRSEGDVSTLAYDGSLCNSSALVVGVVTFQYHMRGASMGTLRILDADGEVAWSLSGDQGDEWRTASAAIYSPSFRFEYQRGISFTGDAAVDEITVACSPAPSLSPRPAVHPVGHLLNLSMDDRARHEEV